MQTNNPREKCSAFLNYSEKIFGTQWWNRKQAFYDVFLDRQEPLKVMSRKCIFERYKLAVPLNVDLNRITNITNS